MSIDYHGDAWLTGFGGVAIRPELAGAVVVLWANARFTPGGSKQRREQSRNSLAQPGKERLVHQLHLLRIFHGGIEFFQ